MLALLQSFVAVLDEPGVSYGRARNAALCAAEGLMRVGPSIKFVFEAHQILQAFSSLLDISSSAVTDIIGSITTFIESHKPSVGLVDHVVSLPDQMPANDTNNEVR